MEEAAKAQKHHYYLRKRDRKPGVGQIVWCKTHYLSNAAEKFNGKLAPKYDGPRKVTSFLSPLIVIIKYPTNKRTKGNLKPYSHTNNSLNDSRNSELEDISCDNLRVSGNNIDKFRQVKRGFGLKRGKKTAKLIHAQLAGDGIRVRTAPTRGRPPVVRRGAEESEDRGGYVEQAPIRPPAQPTTAGKIGGGREAAATRQEDPEQERAEYAR